MSNEERSPRNTTTSKTTTTDATTKSTKRTAVSEQQQFKQTAAQATGTVKFQHQQLLHQQPQQQKYSKQTTHYNCNNSTNVAQLYQQQYQQHTQPQYQLITAASGEFASNKNGVDTSFLGNWFGLLLKVLFSPPGLVALVVGYSILGACIFPLLEAPLDINTSAAIAKSREECLRELWIITEKLNVLYERNWSTLVHEQLRRFEDSIVAATRHTSNSTSIGMFGGSSTALRRYGSTFDTKITTDATMIPTHWTFGEALLYSVTVITTIGHGSLTPRTAAGKIATILYALIGVPLMLMCLSSLGALLADALQCTYARICCHLERNQHHHHHHHHQEQKHANRELREKQKQPQHDLYQQQTHHLQVTGEKSGHLLEASADVLGLSGGGGNGGKCSRHCSADSLDDSALLKRGLSSCQQHEKGHKLDCNNCKYDTLKSETSLSSAYDYKVSNNIGGAGTDSADDSCRLLHNSPAKLNQNQGLTTTKINAQYHQQNQQQHQRPEKQKQLQQQHYQLLCSRSTTPSPQHLQQQSHEQQQLHATAMQTFHITSASSSPTSHVPYQQEQQQHQQEQQPHTILRQYATLQPHQYKQQQMQQQQHQQYIAVPSGTLVRFGLQTTNASTRAISTLKGSSSNNCTTDGNGNVGIGVGATLIATGMPSNCYQTANVSVATGGTATATIYFPIATATHPQQQQHQPTYTSITNTPVASVASKVANNADGLVAASLLSSGACGTKLFCNQPIVKYHTIQLAHARKQQQHQLGGEQVTLLGSSADVLPLPPPPAYQTATVHGIRRAKLLTKPLPPEIKTLVTDECDKGCSHDLLIQQIGSGDENTSTNFISTIPTQMSITAAPTTTAPTSLITTKTTNAPNSTTIAMLAAGLTATAVTCCDNPPTTTTTIPAINNTAMGTSMSGATPMVGSNATVDIMEDEEEHELHRMGNCPHGTPSRVPLISSSTNNTHGNNSITDDEQHSARSLFNATATSFHRHTLNTFQRNAAARKSATFSTTRRTAAGCNTYVATAAQRSGKSSSCYGDPTTETSDDEETAYMQRDATATTANEQFQLTKLNCGSTSSNNTNINKYNSNNFRRTKNEHDCCIVEDNSNDDNDDDDVNSNADADVAAGGRQVPITLVLLILICYICLGTVIFAFWENWSIVDGAYFCFVTLATIGYGDFMPERTFHGPHVQLFACCAYLLLGLVLVAMSFSILETQLMWKCKRIAVRLKLADDD